MSEKEHPARTAGRYVRAAGIAFKKERERLAAESAAKRAAEEALAQQQAAQQPAPVAVQAPPQPPAQAAAPVRTKRPPPPAPPQSRFLDRLFWVGFMITLVATGLSLLSIQMVASGPVETIVKLVLGGILLVAAVFLLMNVGHAKDRVLTGVTKRLWGLEHPVSRRGRFMRSMAKDVMTLLGIAWLAISTYEILSVFVD